MADLEKSLEKLDHSFVTAILDKVVEGYVQEPSSDTFDSKEDWQATVRLELINMISNVDFHTHLEHGFTLIKENLKANLSLNELEKIGKEWMEGINAINKLFKTEKVEEIRSSSLQELMNISNETLEQFYQCGIREFDHNYYQNASDIFAAIATLSPFQPNVWLALGLAEKRLEHFEQALKTFSMAMITGGDSTPWTYIHAAECCTAIGKEHDAEDCFNHALKITSKLPPNEKEKINNYINKIKNLSKGV